MSFEYKTYSSEKELNPIKKLMDVDLSEPYSIFTLRYFVRAWPQYCYLCYDGEEAIAAIICKTEKRLKTNKNRGYIAMIAVKPEYRKRGIGSKLVKLVLDKMIEAKCDEVVLEAEASNQGALKLYYQFGFIKDKRLIKYYMSGEDAFRLKLYLTNPSESSKEVVEEPSQD
mmetsp:Transcript_806/g.1250  ORF Transcript_806/g.1250 Transcript_806/m.1250 type:complete len:170 (+) Transcript_806:37-546(+)